MKGPEGSRVGGAAGERRVSERRSIGDRDKLRALTAELAISEERERRRIASGLHDQVGQMLGIAKVKLGEALATGPEEDLAGLVLESRQLIERSIREIRTLTFELSSPVLQELGLGPALASLAERMEERHGIRCRVEKVQGPLKLCEEVAVLLHSIVRELLWNVVKHAHASHVEIAIGQDEDRVWVAVEDDGVGFDATHVSDRPSKNGGLGLFGARQRLEYLRGTLEVDSEPSRSTRIVLAVPANR